MAYKIVSPGLAGWQDIAATSTVQNHDLGTIVQAVDPSYGWGEFMYMKGLASTAVGDVCAIDQAGGVTTRVITTTRGPVGVAMSANVASQYGWYQIGGAALPAAAAAVAVGAPLFATATAGAIDDAVTAAAKIDGAVATTAATVAGAGVMVVQLARPSMNGNG